MLSFCEKSHQRRCTLSVYLQIIMSGSFFLLSVRSELYLML